MTEMDPRLLRDPVADTASETPTDASGFIPGELDPGWEDTVPVAEDPVIVPANPNPTPVEPDPVPTQPNVPQTPATPVESPAPAETPTPTDTTDTSGHWLPSVAYDIIKFFAQLFLPAVATLYFALAPTWGWPRADDVVGTITAVDTFLGVFLSYTKGQYLASDAPYDGDLIKTVSETGRTQLVVALNDDPANLRKKATFKVKS